MINYLKQYADKTYEELVNSLIWFDLSLKLKAIFAKIPTTFKTINNESIIGDGNIEITGGNGGNQDLQNVLDVGNFASYNEGNSYVSLLYGEGNNRGIDLFVSNDFRTEETGIIFTKNDLQIRSVSEIFNRAFYIDMASDYFNLTYDKSGIRTVLKFNITPTVSTDIIIPSKVIQGTYTINTTPDTIYTVDTLPLAVLNDMAIVSDATAPTYLGALIGGGTTVTPVWYNGTSWVSR